MIVIAGGSGTLGRLLVSDLLAQGEQVRVLVRDAARARSMLGRDVEIVAVNLCTRDSLDDFVSGASVVVSAVHGFLGGRGAGPVEIDERGNGNLIDAAGQAGADVVLVSVLGAAAGSPHELFRAKYAAEQHLRASGTLWTIVRPPAYLETWLRILTKTAGTSGRPLIFGRGEEPIQFVSAVDVAAVVGRAATDQTLRGQVLEIAGDTITMTELARALQQARGWGGSPRHLPRPVLRIMAVLARYLSPAFARQNKAALAMDTGKLTVEAPAAVPAGPSRQTLPSVLARFTPN